MNLGGGYQTRPSDNRPGQQQQQEFMLPSGYREDYVNTQYGAMMPKGLVLFPSFSFTPAEEQKKKEEQIKNEFIFYEYSTKASHDAMSGVSAPRKKTKSSGGSVSYGVSGAGRGLPGGGDGK
jgi:hypothetical protein